MADQTKKKHQHIDFALRYGSQIEPTLNASSAISRTGSLIDDIAAFVPDFPDPSPASPPEIFSYYAVGFVTCLEWHARARITDLFTYAPRAITDEDLKLVSKDGLVQANASSVTLAQLLGAVIKIGSFEAYLARFERVFDLLDIGTKPSKVLNDLSPQLRAALGSAKTVPAKLSELFDYRNSLVHEIDWGVLGPPTLSNKLSLQDAMDFGSVVHATMSALEAVIGQHAPVRFPNKLDLGGIPINEIDMLRSEITRIELEIASVLDADNAEE